MATVCPVDDCPKQKYRGGYCYAHYMKKWRYGTPTPAHAPRWEDFTGRRFGQLVAIARVDGRWVLKCDCGKETRAAFSTGGAMSGPSSNPAPAAQAGSSGGAPGLPFARRELILQNRSSRGAPNPPFAKVKLPPAS